MLDLVVSGFLGPTSWRLDLRDQNGQTLAGHNVRLDPDASEFELLSDLYRGLWRLDVDPSRREASAQRLLERAGTYVAREILGSEITEILTSNAPLTVNLDMAAVAIQLSAVPLELATGRLGPLIDAGVVFCHRQAATPQLAPGLADDRLRVLSVFAQPEASSALGLVRERRELAALMRGFSAAEALDHRILQYGATAASLTSALSDPQGWDVVHLSGHGGPGRMILEAEDGSEDAVRSAQLLEMFAPCRGRTRLIVLSSCESGAVRALRRRGALQRSARVRPMATTTAATVLPSLGHDLAARVGASVLAMRYPVADSFSVRFARAWYEALIQDGATLAEALRRGLRMAPEAADQHLICAVTPVLMGDPNLRLRQFSGGPRLAGETSHLADEDEDRSPGLPEPTDLFVGRVNAVARMTGILTSRAEPGILQVLGGPGTGRTECLLEVVRGCRDEFDRVTWHQADPSDTAMSLARSWAPLLEDTPDRNPSLLIVDDTDVLLNSDGHWADTGMADLVEHLARVSTRVVMISDQPIAALAARTDRMTIGSLSRSESQWLAREFQELAWGASGQAEGLRYAGLPWLVCRGHPALIRYCSAGSPDAVRQKTLEMDRAWEVNSPTPSPHLPYGRPGLDKGHPGAALTAWARKRVHALAPGSARMFTLLASLEANDRKHQIVDVLWDVVQHEAADQDMTVSQATQQLLESGLVERTPGRFLLHPAVARAGRDADPALASLIAALASSFWASHYESFTEPGDGSSHDYLAGVTASRVPYLMRAGAWEHASQQCEEAINRDRSPAMAARLIPFIREIVLSAVGTPIERTTRYVHATVLRSLNPQVAIRSLQDLYTEAVEAGDTQVALGCASGIVEALYRADPLAARTWLQRAMSSAVSAEFGPWPMLVLQLNEAQVLHQLSAAGETLHRARGLVTELEDLIERGVLADHANPHTLLIAALELGAAAAADLRDHSTEQLLRSRALSLSVEGDDPERATAELQFNQTNALLRAGRLEDARDLLLAAREHFSNPGDEGKLGLVLAELAGIEHRRGHDRDAADVCSQGLRCSYAGNEWLDAARAHQRVATYLTGADDQANDGAEEAADAIRDDQRNEADDEALMHLLAAAVIYLRILGPLSPMSIQPQVLKSATLVSMRIARRQLIPPASLEDLAAELRQTSGVELTEFLAASHRLPILAGRSGDVAMHFGDADGDSLSDVLTLAGRTPPEQLLDVVGHPEHWQDIIDHVVAAAHATPRDVDGVRALCDDLVASGWSLLSVALLRIVSDGTLAAVDQPGTAPEDIIVQRVLARLAKGPGLA